MFSCLWYARIFIIAQKPQKINLRFIFFLSVGSKLSLRVQPLGDGVFLCAESIDSEPREISLKRNLLSS